MATQCSGDTPSGRFYNAIVSEAVFSSLLRLRSPLVTRGVRIAVNDLVRTEVRHDLPTSNCPFGTQTFENALIEFTVAYVGNSADITHIKPRFLVMDDPDPDCPGGGSARVALYCKVIADGTVTLCGRGFSAGYANDLVGFFNLAAGIQAIDLVAANAVAAAIAYVTPSSAQATRTWVSGVGDDINPCSRTAPCKTFAGATGGGNGPARHASSFPNRYDLAILPVKVPGPAGAGSVFAAIDCDGGNHDDYLRGGGGTDFILNGGVMADVLQVVQANARPGMPATMETSPGYRLDGRRTKGRPTAVGGALIGIGITRPRWPACIVSDNRGNDLAEPTCVEGGAMSGARPTRPLHGADLATSIGVKYRRPRRPCLISRVEPGPTFECADRKHLPMPPCAPDKTSGGLRYISPEE